MRRMALASALLVGLTLAAYSDVGRCAFLNLDDSVYVTDNGRVKGGLTLDGIVWAWTTVYAGYWQPVTWMSLQLDAQLFGLHAGGYHWTNVSFHACNVVLVLVVLNRLTGQFWRSLAVAALWAVHPLHVESVVWVTERKDVLSTFFGLLAILAYGRYVSQPRIGRYLLVLLFMGLSLMAKPMLVTLPAVLLLLDWWPLGRWSVGQALPPEASRVPLARRSLAELAWEKVPLLILAAVFGAITSLAHRHQGALMTLDHLSLEGRLSNALVSYVRYLGMTFWPHGLAVFYPHLAVGPSMLEWLSTILVLPTVTWMAWRGRLRCPYLAVGWLWYLGTLVPVLGLLQAGSQAYADRFTYVPHIGLFVAIVWGAADLLASAPGLRRCLAATGIVLVGSCFFLTRQQVGYWKDSYTMWNHTLAVTAFNHVAHNNLGQMYLTDKKMKEAIYHLQMAVQLSRNYADGHNCLGVALASVGQRAEATQQFAEAIRIAPNHVDAHVNLGAILSELGQKDEAITHYAEALRINPHHEKAHYNWGITLLEQGKTEEASRQFQEALRINPRSGISHHKLGQIALESQDFGLAGDHLARAANLLPEQADVHADLGALRQLQGRLSEAIESLRAAVRLQPAEVEYRCMLGLALYDSGQVTNAEGQYQEALGLNPDWPRTDIQAALGFAADPDPARRNGKLAWQLARRACQATRFRQPEYLDTLGAALAELGRFDEAVAAGQQALEMAQKRGQAELATSVQGHLQLWKDRKPLRIESR